MTNKDPGFTGESNLLPAYPDFKRNTQFLRAPSRTLTVAWCPQHNQGDGSGLGLPGRL
jgi:hypothetical protein